MILHLAVVYYCQDKTKIENFVFQPNKKQDSSTKYPQSPPQLQHQEFYKLKMFFEPNLCQTGP